MARKPAGGTAGLAKLRWASAIDAPHGRHDRDCGLERGEDAKGDVVGIEGREAGASGLHPAGGTAGAVIDADGPASFLPTADALGLGIDVTPTF
ncbi:MAG: hypothetical protein HC909_01905 [Blastochloris sp.]|nr:hypothetical protein [Blastochloris sp.]